MRGKAVICPIVHFFSQTFHENLSRNSSTFFLNVMTLVIGNCREEDEGSCSSIDGRSGKVIEQKYVAIFQILNVPNLTFPTWNWKAGWTGGKLVPKSISRVREDSISGG